ncbi:MAG: CocE/NonD family hydrolase [Aestuariivirgaceae bacterium]
MFPGQEPPELETVADFPHDILDEPVVWIDLPDSFRLAARIWRPVSSDDEPVPAVLEYIPYRRRDARLADDERIHPWFAGHGIAGVRVDVRGSGDSEGHLRDEYLKLEQDDAIAVIAWIAAQPWCSGQVGMMGLSWGGFSALQVAARNPPALKAIIAVGATVDRYNDDVHYKNGCLLNENFGWATSFLSFASRPPDPKSAGSDWRKTWLERLDNLEFFAETWFAHPARDDYWKHGSVCEDFDAIKCPVMIVTGWGDLYVNALPQLLANLKVPCRAIAGPWAHQFPHLSSPGPSIDFLGQATEWWQCWLNDEPSPQESECSYLGFIQHGTAPNPFATSVPGHWLETFEWPSPNIQMASWYASDAGLTSSESPAPPIAFRSPLNTGTACGELVPHCSGPEMAPDQRTDDARSLVFDTGLLDNAIDIWGDPVFEADIVSGAADGNLIVRLCDIAPGGASQRVSFGVVNLRHVAGSGAPKPFPVNEPVRCRIKLNHVAHRFPAGHKIRLALSTACWPFIWPATVNPLLSLAPSIAKIELPVIRQGERLSPVRPPAPKAPRPANVKTLRAPANERRIIRDEVLRRTIIEIRDDYGELEFSDHGMVTSGVKRERYTINDNDPLSATCDIHWTQNLRRGDWSVTTKTIALLTCNADKFHLSARVTAFEGDEQVFEKSWLTDRPRT